LLVIGPPPPDEGLPRVPIPGKSLHIMWHIEKKTNISMQFLILVSEAIKVILNFS